MEGFTAKVDIVKVNSPTGWDPRVHHVVEEDRTERVLFSFVRSFASP